MYIKRNAESTIKKLLKQYPAIAIIGPRQSGKSTLAKKLLKNKPYSSLENLDEREFAANDPRGFLDKFTNGGVIDEVQKVPELLSYLQSFLDEKKNSGPIILTGSAQLTLLANITQTLAGRLSIIELLPLSYGEFTKSLMPKTMEHLLYAGFYPGPLKNNLDPSDWFNDYAKTYIERDVRDILKVHNLGTFQKFIKMCASRAGQILNLSNLANDCGISHATAEAWINILEATYITARIQPHHVNFSKRLIKSPKIYFYDTGLLCFMLGIRSPEELKTHSSRGAVMENWLAIEIIKHQTNNHQPRNIYFWRDNKGVEIDFIVEKGEKLRPIEVKSGKTVASDYFKNLDYWQKLANKKTEKGIVFYAGDTDQQRTAIEIVGWNSISKILKIL